MRASESASTWESRSEERERELVREQSGRARPRRVAAHALHSSLPFRSCLEFRWSPTRTPASSRQLLCFRDPTSKPPSLTGRITTVGQRWEVHRIIIYNYVLLNQDWLYSNSNDQTIYLLLVPQYASNIWCWICLLEREQKQRERGPRRDLGALESPGCHNHSRTTSWPRLHRQSYLGWHFRKFKAQSSKVSFTMFQWKHTFELWGLSFETAFENVTPSGIGCTFYTVICVDPDLSCVVTKQN